MVCSHCYSKWKIGEKVNNGKPYLHSFKKNYVCFKLIIRNQPCGKVNGPWRVKEG